MAWFRRTVTGDEGIAHQYTTRLVQPDGTRVGAANITALTLTLYDERTSEILNGRDHLAVLNTATATLTDETISEEGSSVDITELTWEVTAADMAIVDDTLGSEVHIARFDFVYGVGAKPGAHEVAIRVRNLELTPGVA